MGDYLLISDAAKEVRVESYRSDEHTSDLQSDVCSSDLAFMEP